MQLGHNINFLFKIEVYFIFFYIFQRYKIIQEGI